MEKSLPNWTRMISNCPRGYIQAVFFMTISSQREFNNKLRLSVVVPAHNEAGNLHNLINEICIALSKIDGNSEIIFVDDGSSDNSIELLLSIQANCPKLRGSRPQEVFRSKR